MGQIVSITIGNYDFLSCKNSFGDLLKIFSEQDLRIEEPSNLQDVTKRCFLTDVKKAKMCLDVLGHTLDAARLVFDKMKSELLDYYQDDEEYVNQLETNYTFECWMNAVKHYSLVLSKDYFSPEYEYVELERQRNLPHNIAEQMVLDSLPFGDDAYFGIPFEYEASWDVFRIILEAFDDTEKIVLDYTWLYEAGWCEEIPNSELYDVPRIVILTEGKYDAYVISNAMKLLYPFMCKFYSFIDFSAFSIQGSTNYLTHYLKVFVGAGIRNKIIALYDNDAAGLCEIKNLEKYKLPSNVRIMHLPDIPLCENYPTIGPINNESTNINGRACSIELFLGKDVLLIDGEFEPIMWSGYIDKVKAYQGEIKNKGGVQKRFDEKIKKSEMTGIDSLDNWEECNILLESIFNAF